MCMQVEEEAYIESSSNSQYVAVFLFRKCLPNVLTNQVERVII